MSPGNDHRLLRGDACVVVCGFRDLRFWCGWEMLHTITSTGGSTWRACGRNRSGRSTVVGAEPLDELDGLRVRFGAEVALVSVQQDGTHGLTVLGADRLGTEALILTHRMVLDLLAHDEPSFEVFSTTDPSTADQRLRMLLWSTTQSVGFAHTMTALANRDDLEAAVQAVLVPASRRIDQSAGEHTNGRSRSTATAGSSGGRGTGSQEGACSK